VKSLTTTGEVRASSDRTDKASGVLYVQASGHARAGLADRLSRIGLPATIAADAPEALRLLAGQPFALAVVDLAGERAALTTVRLVRARHPDLPLAAVVDPARNGLVGEALQAGIADLLPWPFDPADLAAILGHHRERSGGDGRPSGHTDEGFRWFLDGPAMAPVREAIAAAGAVRQGVAICGEPGSGHELAARAIHAIDDADQASFVHVRCADHAAALEDSLFGNHHDRGSDPDRIVERVSTGSALDRGAGGTVYLEQVAEAPARVQARLARLLRDRETMDEDGRVRPMAARLVASIEGTVSGALADGRLRRDLADRLVSHVDLPAVRGRVDDIPRLASHYLAGACHRHGLPRRHFSRGALALLSALPWPQNLVDLERLSDAAACAAPGLVVHVEDVLAQTRLDTLTPCVHVVMTLRDARRRFERECIAAALARHHGRVGEAAKALGIQRTNLYRKVRQLDVDRTLLSARRQPV
jgi:DNA-binding NtrC family response regulator